MMNLKQKPFYLSDEQMKWVKKTIEGMTLEEKVGQLFCPICVSAHPEYLKNEIMRFHVGGMLFKTSPSKDVRTALDYMQSSSKVPMLCTANLEYGSTGMLEDGTFFAQQMAVGASGKDLNAYRLGLVSCKEAAAVGCNVAFAPVCDLDLNWRNPIVNVRSYGDNADVTLAMCKAYMQGAKEAGVEVTVKHFPGDGVDEVDQHLLTSVNTLSCDEWDQTYGKIYQGLIDADAKLMMIGHIALPSYQKALNPEHPDQLIPATLSPELLEGLLRDKLGFEGLIMTDATPMVGFTSAMKRADAVPLSIAAGCDMFLFNKSLEEDYRYMMDGVKNGVLTMARLEEAVMRILALKASMNLHTSKLIPDESALEVVGCDEHRAWAKECADESITLVKDTAQHLPLDAAKTKHMLLEVIGGFPSDERVKQGMKTRMEQEGFEVTLYTPEDFDNYTFGVEPFTDAYDIVLYLGNIETVSNQTASRLSWHTLWGNGDNLPWFVKEVPVVFASLGNPYHLVDVPMIQTYINCYANSDIIMDELVEKLMGRSTFKGQSPTDPFLGKEYLRY